VLEQVPEARIEKQKKCENAKSKSPDCLMFAAIEEKRSRKRAKMFTLMLQRLAMNMDVMN
jgi:hypothetical protein